MTDLAGKVAIVTGGSRGIGAGIAFVLAKAGAAVTLVARDRRRVSQLADEIVANGDRALALACDVADYGSVRAMVAEAERQLGGIDILVNNAGVIEPIGGLAQSDPAVWRRSIEVNRPWPAREISSGLDTLWVLRSLRRNATLAARRNDTAASNRAVELIGRHLNMFIERKVVEINMIDDSDEYLRQLMEAVGIKTIDQEPAPLAQLENGQDEEDAAG